MANQFRAPVPGADPVNNPRPAGSQPGQNPYTGLPWQLGEQNPAWQAALDYTPPADQNWQTAPWKQDFAGRLQNGGLQAGLNHRATNNYQNAFTSAVGRGENQPGPQGGISSVVPGMGAVDDPRWQQSGVNDYFSDLWWQQKYGKLWNTKSVREQREQLQSALIAAGHGPNQAKPGVAPVGTPPPATTKGGDKGVAPNTMEEPSPGGPGPKQAPSPGGAPGPNPLAQLQGYTPLSQMTEFGQGHNPFNKAETMASMYGAGDPSTGTQNLWEMGGMGEMSNAWERMWKEIETGGVNQRKLRKTGESEFRAVEDPTFGLAKEFIPEEARQWLGQNYGMDFSGTAYQDPTKLQNLQNFANQYNQQRLAGNLVNSPNQAIQAAGQAAFAPGAQNASFATGNWMKDAPTPNAQLPGKMAPDQPKTSTPPPTGGGGNTGGGGPAPGGQPPPTGGPFPPAPGLGQWAPPMFNPWGAGGGLPTIGAGGSPFWTGGGGGGGGFPPIQTGGGGMPFGMSMGMPMGMMGGGGMGGGFGAGLSSMFGGGYQPMQPPAGMMSGLMGGYQPPMFSPWGY